MITSFSIRNFRNLIQFQIDTCFNINYIYGDNNQGKTTLLEAIYIFLSGNYLYEKDIYSLVNFNQTKAVLSGNWYDKDHTDNIYITLDKQSGFHTVINKKIEKKKSFEHKFCIADYLSSDVNRYFQESPEQRRKVIDDFCSVYFPLFSTNMKQYLKVSKQKNMLLKAPKIDSLYRDVLNQQLADFSANIVSFRQKALQIIFNYFCNNQINLFGDIFSDIKINYFCHRLSLNSFDTDAYKEAFLKQIKLDETKERYLGYTLIGAKRDDFDITLKEKSLFRYYSKGINRLFSILFKLAQWRILSDKCEKPLILLLDDAFSEIDRSKRVVLSQYVSNYYQLFVTSTDKYDAQFYNNVKIFSISKVIK